MQHLEKNVKVSRVMNAVAAGTSDQNSSSVKQDGFAGARFIACFGALTATQVTGLKVQGCDDNSTWVDITGASAGPMADGDGNKCLIVEVYKPRNLYLRGVVTRGTANAVIDGMICEQYGERVAPQADSTTVSAATLVTQ